MDSRGIGRVHHGAWADVVAGPAPENCGFAEGIVNDVIDQVMADPKLIPYKVLGILSHIKWMRTRPYFEEGDERASVDRMIAMLDEWDEYKQRTGNE
jgi:hypothetical protein